MNVHFQDNENILVFIDDANNLVHLSHLIGLAIDRARKHTLKIIITVRDYAASHVAVETKKEAVPYIYDLQPLKKEQIKEIIASRFKFSSFELINRITDISSGNVRLAIMAGISAKNDEYEKINNAVDIYKAYYSDSKRIKLLLDVLSCNDENFRRKILMKFLNLNKDDNIFKTLELFPTSYSISGSEMPYIENKIQYLKSIIENLQSIEYLMHRAYLQEYINGLEKQKEKILYEEYLETL